MVDNAETCKALPLQDIKDNCASIYCCCADNKLWNSWLFRESPGYIWVLHRKGARISIPSIWVQQGSELGCRIWSSLWNDCKRDIHLLYGNNKWKRIRKLLKYALSSSGCRSYDIRKHVYTLLCNYSNNVKGGT